MRLYSFEHYMRTHPCVDYQSLIEFVEQCTSADCTNHDREYYSRYSEEYNALANLSAYVYNELERIPYELGEHLPFRKYKFDVFDGVMGSGIIWFNYATAWLPNSNLFQALSNEEQYSAIPDRYDDIWNVDYKIRSARRNAVTSLPKEKLLTLLISVCGIVGRVSELREALNTLNGLISELGLIQNVIVQDDGTVIHHPGAYF